MNIKNDFPIFNNAKIDGKPLIYLDNAATTQKPHATIDAISYFYENHNSNIGRSVYQLADAAYNDYENTRKKVGKFIGTTSRNIAITHGCTHALNLAAHILKSHIMPNSKILLSISEHHANILPWQRLAKEKNLQLVFLKDAKYLADPQSIPSDILEGVAVIALAHVSNVTGEILPLDKWQTLATSIGAVTVIDGAQGICSTIVDIKKTPCDFYAFSAHKLYGPMGVGFLYISNKWISDSEPLLLGGGIIDDVEQDDYVLLDNINKFEAGTPNVADVSAFSATLDYLQSIDWPARIQEMHTLGEYLYASLKEIAQVKVIQMDNNMLLHRSHLCSFVVEDVHAHDVGTFLAQQNIAVRVGKHCTHPLHAHFNISSSVRASIGIYNTAADIDILCQALKNCIQFFGVNHG